MAGNSKSREKSKKSMADIKKSANGKDDSGEISVSSELLKNIRDENLSVYRASPKRLQEDLGQESQIAQDYHGRLIYELLQNADDAMANSSNYACIRFELTEKELWVANSGRPLDESDVRGLCGISASKKATHVQSRRASIGHKGMGFKSALDISSSPEVYSRTICFCFNPTEALECVQSLISEGRFTEISRSPVARFPWPVDENDANWKRFRKLKMNTAFRFPFKEKMTEEQVGNLSIVLQNLPLTSLVFLKHIGRIEVEVKIGENHTSFAWSIQREYLDKNTCKKVAGFEESGDYYITLTSDEGKTEKFLLSHDADIEISSHRGGIDDYTWEGVEFTEVSVAARMSENQPVPLDEEWRLFHVFLPTGETCPYNLLVSGAFSSNLSRQEIRVEEDSNNYNRFLLAQSARVLVNCLIPRLLEEGASVVDCLKLLKRSRNNLHTPNASQAFYEEVVNHIADLKFLPCGENKFLSIQQCIVPPLVENDSVGGAFRDLMPNDVECDGLRLPVNELCGSSIARILVDHGTQTLTPEKVASLLASADPSRSELVLHENNKVFVDPVLNVLAKMLSGLGGQDRYRLITATRQEALFPVSRDGNTVNRICTEKSKCFFPPQIFSGEVPLKGLCFLIHDICWGGLTPMERSSELQSQMLSWQELFGIRDFVFSEVMRTSVLPALDLDRDRKNKEREDLKNLDCLAAICQLSGRTPNADEPLPYERLSSNRALFNLSRLDVPCRGSTDEDVEWIPAYQAYFGSDWIDTNSVEEIIKIGRDLEIEALPDIKFILGPDRFRGLLECYRHLNDEGEAELENDIGEDEVGIDENEESLLDSDDREHWFQFFQWLGVNSSLRPVHFHDVEDRASGWLKTRNLVKPEGWAFQNIPEDTWTRFTEQLHQLLTKINPVTDQQSVPYFYELHDLEHLVVLANAASVEPTAQFARALYEHIGRHWDHLEKFSQARIARVSSGAEPTRRRPPMAKPGELIYVGLNFWLFRLKLLQLCPTSHGPRTVAETWLPSAEIRRRFGHPKQNDTYLLPVLDIDPLILNGKARTLFQSIGIREELSSETFTISDARNLLKSIERLYQSRVDSNEELRFELRQVIRPAYRNLIELLSGSSEKVGESPPLAGIPILVSDELNGYCFSDAGSSDVFYLARRDTRERLESDDPIWTFVIEASPAARAVLPKFFGMRVLEDSLTWIPKAGDPALDDDECQKFREKLTNLAYYILSRVGADRTDEKLEQQDAKRLRKFIEVIEPVTHLDLECKLGERVIKVKEDSREAYVDLDNEGKELAFVVWGENPWPPCPQEAETLAVALCNVLGAGYFESFFALIQTESEDRRRRILRHAGAPLDLEDKRSLFHESTETLSDINGANEESLDKDLLKTAAQEHSMEESAEAPYSGGVEDGGKEQRSVPLYDIEQLLIQGEPSIITGRDRNNVKAIKRIGELRSKRDDKKLYSGNTDLGKLNILGMSVAMLFEQYRLRGMGLENAIIFESLDSSNQDDALIFDVSTPATIENARSNSNRLNNAFKELQKFDVRPDWPGFDILTLNTQTSNNVDRMIELKSSSRESRTQEMSWNEWKSAKSSKLRKNFYLYLVGNLRADIGGATPFIRTIRNPFEQLTADVQTSHSLKKKVQLLVKEFDKAEHLDLSVITDSTDTELESQ